MNATVKWDRETGDAEVTFRDGWKCTRVMVRDYDALDDWLNRAEELYVAHLHAEEQKKRMSSAWPNTPRKMVDADKLLEWLAGNIKDQEERKQQAERDGIVDTLYRRIGMVDAYSIVDMRIRMLKDRASAEEERC